MTFSLGHLLEAALLFINAVAVLQDYSPNLKPGGPPVPRFLTTSTLLKPTSPPPSSRRPRSGSSCSPCRSRAQTGTVGLTTADDHSVKGKIVTMINAVRTLMRVPLIAVNAVMIVYLLLAG
ncbi:uncharacterized protein MONBRDRAFT_10660 [Monosiga brevicollis MX1]|uniref:Immediate early response 3-interacting protein 1 n=1 Tax=Monosiga brevicollis TaxID=81824 RepID=A9V6V1_MONBE|nr:uncharacterized protein MONBRDRAFT_10660 [Monosiga brevicollis MX1]EDQ86607.1 predicted protein [Monosiga brevicollis MX1]|eukprot:XP_001748443.1 hypothetical protein [Monosiga brevicollis MX1]